MGARTETDVACPRNSVTTVAPRHQQDPGRADDPRCTTHSFPVSKARTKMCLSARIGEPVPVSAQRGSENVLPVSADWKTLPVSENRNPACQRGSDYVLPVSEDRKTLPVSEDRKRLPGGEDRKTLHVGEDRKTLRVSVSKDRKTLRVSQRGSENVACQRGSENVACR